MDSITLRLRQHTLYPLLALLSLLLGSLSPQLQANTALSISGQVSVPADFALTDSNGYPVLGVEIYDWDSVTGTYNDYPMNGSSIAADGSYSLELAQGNYKIVPFDNTNTLHFSPTMQEVTVSTASGPATADFIANTLGVSGQVTLPADYSTSDPYALGVEIYDWDSVAGTYNDYPMNGSSIAADGSYSLELAEGNYKIVPFDNTNTLYFTPAIQEVMVSVATGPATADFVAVRSGISGQLTIDPRDASSINFCNLNGACRFQVKLFAFDSLTSTYQSQPSAIQPVEADGRYRINLPHGTYKAVISDTWQQLAFTPAEHAGLELNDQQTTAVADFAASRMRLSGQVELLFSDPEYSFCATATDCRIVVQAFEYDAGSYSTTPIAVTSVGPDGRYSMALSQGTYRLQAVDSQGQLAFQPAQRDGLVIDGSVAEQTGLNFQALQPQPALSVQSIDMAINSNKRGWHAEAVITVIDPQGNPLPDAEVHGYWSGLVQATEIGVTLDRRKQLGQVTFTSPRTQASGSISFTVTDIIHPLYPYNAALNVETQDSVTY